MNNWWASVRFLLDNCILFTYYTSGELEPKFDYFTIIKKLNIVDLPQYHLTNNVYKIKY